MWCCRAANLITARLLQAATHCLTRVQSGAIAIIGSHDWPEQWPTLFDSLVECITRNENPHLFDGALKCLLFFVEHLDVEAMPKALQRMAPSLLALLSSTKQSLK